MNCLVVVAHPDDETIWMGGTIIRHSNWNWRIISLCRADDPDRAPRFHQAVSALDAQGWISDLDDASPLPAPLSDDQGEIKNRIRQLAPRSSDLIFTHGAAGEYTRHERHEQVNRAVCEMVQSGDMTGDLICFAYDDCQGRCRPRPDADAQLLVELTSEEHALKQHIIRDIYGLAEDGFEFESAGPIEAFSACGNDLALGSLTSVHHSFAMPVFAGVSDLSAAEIPKHMH